MSDFISRKTGHWVHEKDAYFCSECGVGLLEYGRSGEPIYFIDGYNRSNHERRQTFPAWQSWAMNYCPHCGADMKGETE